MISLALFHLRCYLVFECLVYVALVLHGHYLFRGGVGLTQVRHF